MSKTAVIICNFRLSEVFALIPDSCTSQEESVSCTEVRSLTNIMDYCLGYTQLFFNQQKHKILSAEAQKHARIGMWDSPRLVNRDKCHPFQSRGGEAGGKSGAYL